MSFIFYCFRFDQRFLRGRLTIYASPSDRALRLSQMLFRSMARLVQLTPDRISPAVADSGAKWGNIDIVVYEASGQTSSVTRTF